MVNSAVLAATPTVSVMMTVSANVGCVRIIRSA